MSRQMGSECEYGVTVLPAEQPDSENPEGWQCPDSDLLNAIQEKGLDALDQEYGLKKAGTHTSNGARVYVDCAAHPEYCTPETTLDEIAAVEIAGERITYFAYEAARKAGIIRGFRLNKCSTDGRGEGWGYHENYMLRRQECGLDLIQRIRLKNGAGEIIRDNFALLALHLATRQIYAGAGAVTRNKYGKAAFVISQKASLLTDTFYDGTVRQKPLVNLRDEPLDADREKYMRLHVVSGDPHMSPRATEMTFGTTSLVLAMIEHGLLKGLPFSYRPEETHILAKEIARDPTCQKLYTGLNGQKFRATDVQRELMERSHLLDDRCRLTPAEKSVRSTWEQACDTIDDDPLKLTWADWTAVYRILRNKYGDPGTWTGTDDDFWEDVSSLWGRFNTVGTPGSLGERVREKAWADDMPSEDQIRTYMRFPPLGGRAAVRGALIRAGNCTSADWQCVKPHNRPLITLPAEPLTTFSH